MMAVAWKGRNGSSGRGWLTLALAGLLWLAPAWLHAPSGGPPPEQGGSGVDPHELIVEFADDIRAHVQRATHRAYGTYRRMRSRLAGWEVVVLPPYADREEVRRRYIEDPHVVHVERNRTVQALGWSRAGLGDGGAASAATEAHEWLHNNQWGLARSGVPQLWQQMEGDGYTPGDAAEIVVAVLDTGVARNHPDLKDNIWQNADPAQCDEVDSCSAGDVHPVPCDDQYGWDFTYRCNDASGDGQPNDGNGHGSHVAGIIGAHGGPDSGVSGVARDVQLMALRFMDENGQGNTADAARAIEGYAVEQGADIINASYEYSSAVGSSASQRLPTSCADLINQDGRAECEAIERAKENGILVVAAAGNAGQNNDHQAVAAYPASLPLANIISVAASGEGGGSSSAASDALADFSNYGRRTVHLAAPGEGIYSTYIDSDEEGAEQHSYKELDGTSMAAPMVSGLAALLMSRYNRNHGAPQNPAARRERMLEVRERLLGTLACNADIAAQDALQCHAGELEGGMEVAYEYRHKLLMAGRLDALAAWDSEYPERVNAVRPSHLSVTGLDSNGPVELTWLGSSPSTQEYIIERQRPGESGFSEIARVPATIGPHSYTENEAVEAQTLYRVQDTLAPLPQPELNTVTVSNGQVEVDWADYPLPERGCLELRRSQRSGVRDWQIEAGHNSYVDSPGRGEYWYKVRGCLDCDVEYPLGKQCSPWSASRQVAVRGGEMIRWKEIEQGINQYESDPRCLIATAAYGSPYAAEVERLRVFRDEVLLQHPLGRALVELYYSVSPPLAEWLAEQERLKWWVRNTLAWVFGWGKPISAGFVGQAEKPAPVSSPRSHPQCRAPKPSPKAQPQCRAPGPS